MGTTPRLRRTTVWSASASPRWCTFSPPRRGRSSDSRPRSARFHLARRPVRRQGDRLRALRPLRVGDRRGYPFHVDRAGSIWDDHDHLVRGHAVGLRKLVREVEFRLPVFHAEDPELADQAGLVVATRRHRERQSRHREFWRLRVAAQRLQRLDRPAIISRR